MPALPLTEEEAEESSCLLSSFISEDEVAEQPFIFPNNVEITKIYSAFYSLASYLTINNTYNTTNNLNYNSNFLFNQQNNVSYFSSILIFQNWSNQTNSIICNIFQNIPSGEDFAENDSFSSFNGHSVHPINEHMESEALIEHHEVILIYKTIQSDAMIQFKRKKLK